MGSTYVMADIHGNVRRLDSVMEKIGLTKDDTLIVAGDVIDRHPDGIRILMRFMDMPNVKMLLGNHEHMMLRCLDTEQKHVTRFSDEFRQWYRNGGEVTHDTFMLHTPGAKDAMLSYLRELPLTCRLEINGQKWLIVHAAPPWMMTSRDKLHYRNETEYAVWARHFDFDRLPEGEIMVFGHTPVCAYSGVRSGTMNIWHCPNGKAIGIDCGCGFPDPPLLKGFTYEGRLACLRLDDKKEFYSEV